MVRCSVYLWSSDLTPTDGRLDLGTHSGEEVCCTASSDTASVLPVQVSHTYVHGVVAVPYSITVLVLVYPYLLLV